MVEAADKFVFYDDVNYIKGGWINRNRLIVNNEPWYFSATLRGASSFKKINEIEINLSQKHLKKILNTVRQNYSKAPYFSNVMALIENTFQSESNVISELAGQSVIDVSTYLGIDTQFHYSSNLSFGHNTEDRAERLLKIAKGFNENTYINPEGGKDLYRKDYFKTKDISLYFIQSSLRSYEQFSKEFIPGLSIIDVLMHNSIKEIKEMLTDYKLK